MVAQRQKFIEDLTEDLIKRLGCDPCAPNFNDTPGRVARMWMEYIKTPFPELTTFPLTEREGLILVRDHKTWGFCPHHLLPVEYTITIGYLPRKGLAIGLSKPSRIADWVCAQFPLQEEIAPKICDLIDDSIEPNGVGCIVRGIHMCTRMRGVKSPCAEAVSDCLMGSFLHETRVRDEFFRLGGY